MLVKLRKAKRKKIVAATFSCLRRFSNILQQFNETITPQAAFVRQNEGIYRKKRGSKKKTRWQKRNKTKTTYTRKQTVVVGRFVLFICTSAHPSPTGAFPSCIFRRHVKVKNYYHRLRAYILRKREKKLLFNSKLARHESGECARMDSEKSTTPPLRWVHFCFSTRSKKRRAKNRAEKKELFFDTNVAEGVGDVLGGLTVWPYICENGISKYVHYSWLPVRREYMVVVCGWMKVGLRLRYYRFSCLKNLWKPLHPLCLKSNT